MLRNMVTSFIDRGQIETTDAKAKEVRSLAERMVTLAKRGEGDLAARRQVLKVVRDKKVVAKLFSEIGPRYADRPGGYTRIVKVENRRGDGASLSMLQFVMEPVTFKEKKARDEEVYEEDRRRAEKTEEAPEDVEEAPEELAGEEAPEPEGEDAETPDEGDDEVAEEKPPAGDEPDGDAAPDEGDAPKEG